MALPRNTRVSQACKVLVLPTIALAAAFCNSEGGPTPAPDAASGSGGSGNGGASSSSGLIFNSASGAGGQGGGPEVPLADAGIPDGDVPAEPVVACDPAADAGGGEICPLPPPACALGRWIIYYKNPECTEGFCHFEASAYDCEPKTCINGACEYNLTL